MEPGRPRDGRDPWLLREQPRQRDLRGRRLLLLGDPPQQIDEDLIRLPVLRREARNDVAEVALVERRLLVDLARQEALPERAEGNQPDTQLRERRHHLLVRLAPPQRVFALQRRARLHRVRAADGLRFRLRKAEMLDLARADEVFY